MTSITTGQSAGALQRAAGLTLAAKADLEAELRRLNEQLSVAPTLWDGAGARAFSAAFVAWSDQQRRVLDILGWLHDQLVAVEHLNAATDAAQAAVFGGAA
jgi:uncharacterized protein YukE